MTGGRCDGRSPCVWRAQYEQAQDEVLLLRYESQKWKEKYLHEKQRRRLLARSLLDAMVMTHEDRGHEGGRHSLTRTRRSSSTFSDKDHIESLLSPTLSSFDFDDDDSSADSDIADDEDTRETIVATKDTAATEAAATKEAVTRHVDFQPSTRGRTTRRQSVRPSRSSTIGSSDVYRVSQANGWRKDARPMPPPPPPTLLYRMLYSKSSSGDLWTTQSHHHKLQSVARSIMFSMQLKKEHVFEHCFVVGLSVGKSEREHAAKSPSGLVGFWKPRVLYQYPQRPGRQLDSSVADFCFPVGVPVTKSKKHQAASLRGAPVSIWSTDAETLQKHVLEPFRTSGYSFQLTGAKGEILHGFCVSILSDVVTVDDGDETGASQPRSPRSDWTKRASCPNGSILRLSEGEESGSFHAKEPPSDKPSASTHLAPICYCFTSKFPFYRLHFSILRMVVENELRVKQQPTRQNENQYEVALTTESSVGIEFAVCRQPNVGRFSGNDGNSNTLTASIATAIQYNESNDTVMLSEESSNAGIHASGDRQAAEARHNQSAALKKSFSSDDVGIYSPTASCVVEKPVVVRILATQSPVFALIQVGDVLEAVDGVSTASLTFDQTLEILKTAPRPLKLRFQRLDTQTTSPISISRDSVTLSPSSVDILHRVRTLKISDPGQWSTVRLPEFSLEYQFPKRLAERWAVGVALRHLVPSSIVKILAHLLLEKQVVIMGENAAMVSAVCTAFMLLLSPFQWQSTYIPQLPSNLLDFLHSPVPFLVGCHALETTEDWTDVCFFDIDANVILAPIADHHIGETSLPHGAELRELFQGASDRYHHLRPASKPWHELSDDEDKIITLTMQESELFLREICGELTPPDVSLVDGKSFYEQVQEQVGLMVRQSHYEEFLEEFSQTQMFCQYCETILKPSTDVTLAPVPQQRMTEGGTSVAAI
ncbi:hypothetical protein Poli38472_006358 [Pythium oligandrum]|uniref:UDENN domain-containing protein n=1 Tax=Pythium oligandrum TaxID=41045 RepID=A0A8K1C4U6_PYTOL|nr:hypothetical protein Poli38472_006358 [Pythium oligandrum]|eukprot:TMW56348.1 hypothetical protein Poli38472_006358 [Pythium oligandrum]